MKTRKGEMAPKRKRIVAAAVLAAAVGVGGYFAVQLVTAEVDGGPDGNLLGVGNPLISDTRTGLSLCVDGAGGFNATGEDTEEVREALEQGLTAEVSLPAEYAEREVVQGCPPSTEDLGTNLGTSLGMGAPSYAPGETPSKHRLFVYFITPELFEATWPGKPYGRGPAEFACAGDECEPVTDAVYVPSSVSRGDLRDGLLDALLLLPREPNPEPILDWEACERGEQPHPDYTCDQYEDWLN